MWGSAHKRAKAGQGDAAIFAEETAPIDARFFCDRIDISELPSAYKPAATVRQQMADFELAEVVDEITSYGCIVVGDWEYNAPWKLKARAKPPLRSPNLPPLMWGEAFTKTFQRKPVA